jgi:bacterial/archaeal transporter family-2 protein
MDTLFIPLSLAAGVLLALQAGANAQLAKAATTLQLAVGARSCFFSSPFCPAPSRPCRYCRAHNGGTPSAEWPLRFTSSQASSVSTGAVVSVGLFIGGQVLISAALDVFGM